VSSSTPELSPRRELWLLLTLAGIQFTHILDFMIMMPLGPILMAALKIGPHEFGLLVAAYSFSAAGAGVLAAAVVDRFERKRVLLTCFALFGLATLACGLAPSFTTLIVARGLAGVFGGIMGALIHTMIGDAIPFARRARASGVVAYLDIFLRDAAFGIILPRLIILTLFAIICFYVAGRKVRWI